MPMKAWHIALQVCEQQYDSYPLHSAHMDWNFKMGHLKAADKSGRIEDVGTKAPANAHYFVPDREVWDWVLRSAAAVILPPPADDKLCSDFKADKVGVGR